ncbi:unnamed protein product [Eretmochelys imbricata]
MSFEVSLPFFIPLPSNDFPGMLYGDGETLSLYTGLQNNCFLEERVCHFLIVDTTLTWNPADLPQSPDTKGLLKIEIFFFFNEAVKFTSLSVGLYHLPGY